MPNKIPMCNFILAGVSLTDYGLRVPSPFTSLEISNSQISSMTSWTLNCVVGGDSENKINIAAFEALLYGAAQSANNYPNSQGIPVSFIAGWLNEDGTLGENMSYQGFTLQFNVSTSGMYMVYKLTGYASLAVQTSMPVINIPQICGFVQPSAVLEGLAKAVRATDFYQLDIDHNDEPTLIDHNAITTSFNKYVRGSYSAEDDYDSFPGLVKLSKSYNRSRDAGGLDSRKANKLSQVINNASVTPISDFLKLSMTDNTIQCCSFSYWVDEPTMTKPGTIHYKSNANLVLSHFADTLEYGTSNSNILSLSGSYNGVAYNMTDMRFTSLGFAIDGSGNTIAQDARAVNSWSSSLSDVFQNANIINDVNAIASQFSGDFTIQIPGSTANYEISQPISLLVMSGNTISPITGIYNIVSVSHEISNSFITTLKIQRLVMSSANQVAARQNIFVSGSSNYPRSAYSTTSNILSPYKVDLGQVYPTLSHMI